MINVKENEVEKFLRECRKIRTPNSKIAYRSHLNNFFKAIKESARLANEWVVIEKSD